MTYIRDWMSSKFGQIRSGTTELAAFEHLKIDVALFLVSQLWLYLGNSQVSVYRTIHCSSGLKVELSIIEKWP